MKVTVLIVNFNNWEDTVECLESVFKSSYKDFEVIVVDNSANDTSINNLQSWAKGNKAVKQTRYPEIVYPEKSKPLDYTALSEEAFYKNQSYLKKEVTFIKANNNGFAAANNIVLKKLIEQDTTDGFVFLLNNDTLILTDTITNLVSNYKKTSKIGIVGCTLIEYRNPQMIQSVGGLHNKYFSTTSQVFEGLDRKEFSSLVDKAKIDYPVGAAMFLSIEVLKKIGLLDEDYFLYYEELDWVQKAKENYGTTYFNDCFVYHKGGVSIGSNRKSYLADKYSIINRINFAKKHNRANLVTVYIGVFISIFKRFLKLKFVRGFKLIKEVFKN